METHYVCRGNCGGTSEVPKACEAESCTMSGQMMEECNCEDSKHGNTSAEMETDDEVKSS